MDRKHIVAVIFARGGSKGLPGKNMKLLDGKPLIAHSIEAALKCDLIERVLVSTDCENIARISKEYGAEVPFMRPSELAGDRSPEWEAWKHAINHILKDGEIDVFITLPPTAPLRNQRDIELCINTYLNNEVDIVVTGCESHRNPYFNMVVKDTKGYVHKVIDNGNVVRRQDVPLTFDLTTVAYVARPQFVLKSDNMFCGNMMIAEIPKIRCLDIDTELDFLIAEKLIKEEKVLNCE